MIPRPTGGKARAETQACVPPAQTPISQLLALPLGPGTRSPVAPVWRLPQPPELMLTVCEEQPLTQKTDPPPPQAPPHQLLPSSRGRQESGYRVNTAGQYLPLPGAVACLPRAASPGVQACPELVTKGKAEGGDAASACGPRQDALSFPICKMAWLEQTDSRGRFQPWYVGFQASCSGSEHGCGVGQTGVSISALHFLPARSVPSSFSFPSL